VADAVLRSIKYYVSRFRGQIKPPVPPPDGVFLPLFDQLIRNILSGGGKGWNPPIVDTRPISIRLDYEPREAPDERVKVVGSAKYALSEHFAGDEARVEVSIRYRYIDDERVGDHVLLRVAPPNGFEVSTEDPAKFVGALIRGEEAKFDFESEPYAPTWSGRLYANGDVVPDLEVGAAE
jgi:hypothetical protein